MCIICEYVCTVHVWCLFMRVVWCVCVYLLEVCIFVSVCVYVYVWLCERLFLCGEVRGGLCDGYGVCLCV